MNDNELTQLAVSFKNGDKSSFDKLYNETYGATYSTVRSKLYREQDCEDVTQECYISLVQSIKSFDESKSFRPWFSMIIRARILDRVRKIYNEKLSISLDETPVDPEFLIEDMRDTQEKREELSRLIDMLPDGQRQIIRLFYTEDKKAAEIAESLNIAEDSVHSQLSRGRAKLKVLILAEESKGNKLYGAGGAGLGLSSISELFKSEAENTTFNISPDVSAKIFSNIIQSTGLSTVASTSTILGGFLAMTTTAKTAIISAVAVALIGGISVPIYAYSENQKQEAAIQLQQEQEEQARLEAEESARQAAEQAKIEAEKKAETERKVAEEKAEQERLAAEKAEAERIAAEQAEAERLAALEAEQAEAAKTVAGTDWYTAESAEQFAPSASSAPAASAPAASAPAASQAPAGQQNPQKTPPNGDKEVKAGDLGAGTVLPGGVVIQDGFDGGPGGVLNNK